MGSLAILSNTKISKAVKTAVIITHTKIKRLSRNLESHIFIGAEGRTILYRKNLRLLLLGRVLSLFDSNRRKRNLIQQISDYILALYRQ